MAHSEETKRKISEAKRGKPGHPQSEESRRKLSEARKGKKREPFSDEWKRKIGEAGKGRKVSEATIAKRLATRDYHPLSEATKEKIAAAKRGKPQSEESKQKHREVALRLASDPEYRAKVSKGVRKAYEDPEFRERNRQNLDEIRQLSIAKITGSHLSKERRAQIGASWKKSVDDFWKDKTYEERLELTRKGREASQNIKISSLELQVKALLDAMDIQYERQKQVGVYRADFYIPGQNLIVEVYGCYWHGCEQCGKSYPKKQARDRSREAYIKACGYELLILWEHDLTERKE